jgi:hypothetical protein
MTTPAADNDSLPSWEDATPALIAIIRDPEAPDEQKAKAWTELRRMARLADRMKEFVPALQLAWSVLHAVDEECDMSDKLTAEVSNTMQFINLSLGSEPAAEEKSNIITL